MDFAPWPKIARLNRDIVVTEKIDGTNAAVLIENLGDDLSAMGFARPSVPPRSLGVWTVNGHHWAVGAQSRSLLLQLGEDNFGFALWVSTHAEELIKALGDGRHFGEWWGSGIQRGYGQRKGLKHFSLFNTARYGGLNLKFEDGSEVAPVPVLYQGLFDQGTISIELEYLASFGSNLDADTEAEGVVVFHTAANMMFKATIKGDEKPKGQS